MQTRARPLPIPSDRLPYMSVVVRDATYYLRVPSLLTLAQIGEAVDGDSIRSVAALFGGVAGGAGLIASFEEARHGGPPLLQALGCLLGVSWADPVVELQAERPTTWTAEAIAKFGGAVYEEMYEAGWTLANMVKAAVALTDQITAATTLEQGVLEKASFFGSPKATTSSEPSTPSAPSSTASPGSAFET